MLESLNKIRVDSPVDLIISQIRDLIKDGTINRGEKLPPERKLAEHLGVSRGHIREALNKLQIYGIVKVQPQSGTFVSGTGIAAVEGLFTDVLKLENSDFRSLVETRILLEKEAARLAAIYRTEEDIIKMEEALRLYQEKLSSDDVAVEEDLSFHIQIAEAGKNSVLKSLMRIISPDIVKSFLKLKVCDQNNNLKTIQEHRNILDMIIRRNPEGAVLAMEGHLEEVIDFSKKHYS